MKTMQLGKRMLCMFLVLVLLEGIVTPRLNTVMGASENFIYMEGTGFADTKAKAETILVERGCNTLYIGDLIELTTITGSYEGYSGTLSKVVKYVSYKSSNSKVLKIDKTSGKATALKPGSVLVTVTYKKVSIYAYFQVVPTGGLKPFRPTNYKKALDATKAYAKVVSKTPTFPDAFSVLQKYKTYHEQLNLLTLPGFALSYAGAPATSSEQKKNPNLKYTIRDDGYALYSPYMLHISLIEEAIKKYAEDYRLTTVYVFHYFQFDTIVGSGKTITATLRGKVTTPQLFGLQYAYLNNIKKVSTKGCSFPIYVKRVGSDSSIPATATVTAGSNVMKITCSKKLASGKKYELCQNSYGNDSMSSWITYGKYTFKTTSIHFTKGKTELRTGQSEILKLTGSPSKIKWSSSNTKIATVTKSGKVTAKKAGTATITARVGKSSYKCTVKVQNKSYYYYETYSKKKLTLPNSRVKLPLLNTFNNEGLVDRTANLSSMDKSSDVNPGYWTGYNDLNIHSKSCQSANTMENALATYEKYLMKKGYADKNGSEGFTVEDHVIDFRYGDYRSPRVVSLYRSQAWGMDLNLPMNYPKRTNYYTLYIQQHFSPSYPTYTARPALINTTKVNQDAILATLSVISSKPQTLYNWIYEMTYGDTYFMFDHWYTVGDCQIKAYPTYTATQSNLKVRWFIRQR